MRLCYVRITQASGGQATVESAELPKRAIHDLVNKLGEEKCFRDRRVDHHNYLPDPQGFLENEDSM